MLSDNVGCSMGLVAVWSHMVGKGQTRRRGNAPDGEWQARASEVGACWGAKGLYRVAWRPRSWSSVTKES